MSVRISCCLPQVAGSLSCTLQPQCCCLCFERSPPAASVCEATLIWPEFSLLLAASPDCCNHCPAGLQTSCSRAASLSSVPMLTTQVSMHLASRPAGLTTAALLALPSHSDGPLLCLLACTLSQQPFAVASEGLTSYVPASGWHARHKDLKPCCSACCSASGSVSCVLHSS